MSSKIEDMPQVGEKWEVVSEDLAYILDAMKEARERKLRNNSPAILCQTFTAIFSFTLAKLWVFLNSSWTIIIFFFFKRPWAIISSLPFLIPSIPKAIMSFIVAPIDLLSSIPETVRLLYGLTLGQAMASSGSITFVAWLLLVLVALRSTRFGHGMESLHGFLFWAPIYSTVLLLISNIGTLGELFGTLCEFFTFSPWSAAFIFLSVFKFLKVFVHLFSYTFLSSYRLPPLYPTVLSSHVTVIIPSIGNFGEDFITTIHSILDNNPARIIVSTVGTEKLIQACGVVEGITRERRLPGRKIEVVANRQPNKRAQCVQSSLMVKTNLIAYADDHVIWPRTFLQSTLAEFEDPKVGIVGTCKRVIREPGNNWSDSLRNFFACIYLERHNYEMTATYNLDGGAWVISGRTQIIRTDIVQSIEYRKEFLSETFLGAGPLNCDDDNFVTRYMIKHGWKTVFHNRPEALVQTTLGTTGGWPKFYQQLLRWSRSIWRSHLKSLFIDGTWKFYPWTSYSMFLSGLLNISILYDPLLFFTLSKSDFPTENNHAGAYLLWILILSRMIKPWPYYMRNKKEMIWAVPAELLFGYFHGAIRLLGLLTCRDISWGGRDLTGFVA
ncbi:d8088f7f-995e-4287-b0ce-486d2859fa28 [Sclerotinia trifoliorum]|uniref:D8088f7f-995e-4287-b0ce-486d2859fa28 n=1 Tax=Sclerotinia trifoliorum TaxID=28548 RepID=A0A8H2VLH7_9HELO|nr:d8088f7f-995e-4287-b0ce-486d2859fa28 [Sclerotinia trifoliorum]